MGKSQRVKGHSFERKIAKDFRGLGFKDAQRNLEYQEGQGVDLENTGLWRVQCKRHKKYVSISKIKEIQLPGLHLLITKGDKEPEIAVMYWDDLQKILKDIGEAY